MALTASSLASAVGVTPENVPFGTGATVLARKTLVIGTYDPAITTITDEVPALVLSPEEAADTYGAGFMLHRLVLASMAGSNKGETWVLPQSEVAGAQATGTLTVTGPATANGTVYLYVGGDLVEVTVTSGDTATDIGDAIEAAITADTDLPVTASNAVGTVTITSKSTGLFGNFIALTFNWGFQEALPAGVAIAVVDMAGGTGVPSMSDACDALGTGDDANEDHYTDVVHGYMQDTTSLNSISTYNGIGNTPVGLYTETVSRPFRSVVGDTVAGSAGLSALTTLGGLRTTDRTSGVIPVPGSPNHPAEIAAIALGVATRLNNNRAEESAYGQILPGVIPGAVGDRWTSSYSSRETAVKAGIGTTTVRGGSVYISDFLTFYHPATIPVASNGYRTQRHISIIQNMLYNIRTNFESSKWLGCSIVADVAKVANIVDRQKARDIESVKDDLISLAKSFRDQAWVYEVDEYTIPNISVAIRGANNGFNTVLPVILSGELGIINTVVEFDTAITVLL